MLKILVVTDASWVRNAVHAALPGPEYTLTDHDDPSTSVTAAIDESVDVVVVDLQVGSMGGMAVARAMRATDGAGSTRRIPCVMLLDRAADTFLARRAGADGWVIKPFTDHALRSGISAAMDAVAATPAD